jgi:hypothetical protein
VDLFFVISGFIIVRTQQQRPRSAVQFLAARALRILPPYWLLTVALALVLALAPGLFHTKQLSAAGLASSLGLHSFLARGELPLLHVGWSIEFEAAFYGLFALALVAGRGAGLVRLLSVLVLALVMLTGYGIALEFLLGAWIARLRGPLPAGIAGALIGAGAALLALDASGPRVLVWGLPAALVVLGAVHAPQIGRGALTRLGDASYSLYLVQVFTIPAAYRLTGGAWSAAALAVALSVLAALVLHRYVEQLPQRLLAAQPRRTLRPS